MAWFSEILYRSFLLENIANKWVNFRFLCQHIFRTCTQVWQAEHQRTKRRPINEPIIWLPRNTYVVITIPRAAWSSLKICTNIRANVYRCNLSKTCSHWNKTPINHILQICCPLFQSSPPSTVWKTRWSSQKWQKANNLWPTSLSPFCLFWKWPTILKLGHDRWEMDESINGVVSFRLNSAKGVFSN